MKCSKFKATPGSHLNDVQAAVVGRELERIESQYSYVTPALIVEEATPKSSVLHNYFTWDNKKAAENWRIEEAKLLVRSVVILPSNQHLHPVRAFVSVKAPNDDSPFEGVAYVNTSSALSNPELREQVLKRAYNELVSWQERYYHLQEFAKVIKVIKQLKVA